MDKYLVVVPSFNGMKQVQIWVGDQVDPAGKPKLALFKRKLERKHLNMTISQLEEEFKNEIAGLSINS